MYIIVKLHKIYILVVILIMSYVLPFHRAEDKINNTKETFTIHIKGPAISTHRELHIVCDLLAMVTHTLLQYKEYILLQNNNYQYSMHSCIDLINR